MPLLTVGDWGWGAPLINEGSQFGPKVMGISTINFPVNFHIEPQYNVKIFCRRLFAIFVPKSRYFGKLNFWGTLISPLILNTEHPNFLCRYRPSMPQFLKKFYRPRCRRWGMAGPQILPKFTKIWPKIVRTLTNRFSYSFARQQMCMCPFKICKMFWGIPARFWEIWG